jgi:hypothetical protein
MINRKEKNQMKTKGNDDKYYEDMDKTIPLLEGYGKELEFVRVFIKEKFGRNDQDIKILDKSGRAIKDLTYLMYIFLIRWGDMNKVNQQKEIPSE